MNQLTERVKRYIDQNNLIKPNAPVLVAVSGGPDSRALLDILYSLRKEYGLKLMVGHFDHQIRGRESRLDRLFVERVAREYGLAVIVGVAKKGEIKNEAQARQARFQFFFQTADKENLDQIILGQTLSDQIETIIHRFIRGSGLKGLAGIRPKQKFGRYNIIRPLLNEAKEDLIKFLNEKKLSYRVDSTNLGLGYTRNKIRHQLIPFLKKINPNLEESLVDRAQFFQLIESHLSKEAQTFLKDADRAKGRIAFPQSSFLSQDQAVRLQIIKETIKELKGSLTDFSSSHLTEVEKIFSQPSKEKKEKHFQNLKFLKRDGKLIITK